MDQTEIHEKKQVLQNVFNQYDVQKKGELSPIQLQMLHGDMRMGGISLPQVFASIKYVCTTDHCQEEELFDLLQEMDRRYFLIQDFRWEFSFLDREQKDTITVEQARWFMQSVHGRLFSSAKWNHFVKNRAVPAAGVTFPEIEVMLCDIPNKASLEEEEREREKLRMEKQKRLKAQEAAMKAERERKQKEREQRRAQLEAERLKEEEERRRKEKEEEHKRWEEEKRRKLQEAEEQERLKRAEEEERRRREEEEQKYEDAEIHKEAAEKATQEAENELEKIMAQKKDADERRLKELEEQEAEQRRRKRDNNNKRIRYQLKVAIRKRDKFELEYSISEFTKAKLSDDDMDLERAKRLLRQLSAKEGLKKAISKRDIEELEKAMTFVRKNGFETELAGEMLVAGKLLSRLRRLERIRHEILELKQSTVAEIRSYQNPPEIVHTVMTATFLLLGHKEKESKDWKAVQALVGKTGKESLKRRCLELDASKVPHGPAKRANKLLEKFELDDVRDISAGAATFFVWATAMIEEALHEDEQDESVQ